MVWYGMVWYGMVFFIGVEIIGMFVPCSSLGEGQHPTKPKEMYTTKILQNIT